MQQCMAKLADFEGDLRRNLRTIAPRPLEKCSRRDGQHMSALMESAKGMLNSGATPDVVSVAEETLADIAAVVIPAIVDESKIKQEAVLEKWTQMRQFIDRVTVCGMLR